MATILAGCDSTNVPASQPDAAVRQLSLDVVITDAGAIVYTNNTDYEGGAGDEMNRFPQPGETIDDDDVVMAGGVSCLTQVAFDGIGFHADTSSGSPGIARGATLPMPWPSGLALVLSGCGADAVRIPIAPTQLPMVTVTASADQTARTITATWTSDAPTASAVVVFGTSVWDNRVHARTSPLVYQPATGVPVAAYFEVTVDALLAPVEVRTTLGTTRIWRGGTARMSLPQ